MYSRRLLLRYRHVYTLYILRSRFLKAGVASDRRVLYAWMGKND